MKLSLIIRLQQHYNYVVDSILGGKNIKGANIVAASNSKSVVDYVHKTPNAIGVIGSNWLNDHRDSTNTTFKKDITVVGISQATVAQPGNSWQPYQAYLWMEGIRLLEQSMR